MWAWRAEKSPPALEIEPVTRFAEDRRGTATKHRGPSGG